jgi:hypothetical protein
MKGDQKLKKKMPLWRKVTFTIISLIVLLAIWTAIFPPNYYKMGNDYLGRKDYESAYKYFGKVKKEDSNYNAALLAIVKLKPIIDSLQKATNIEEKPEKFKETKGMPLEKQPLKQNQLEEKVTLQEKLTSIPGIGSGDIYENLINRGYKLTKEFGSDFCFFYCEKTTSEGTYYVRIGGRTPSQIEEIKASFTNYSNVNTNSLAKDFLGLMATVPYNNASPDAAKEWIINNINKTSSTEFGGVKFEMYANTSKVRILRIHVGE